MLSALSNCDTNNNKNIKNYDINNNEGKSDDNEQSDQSSGKGLKVGDVKVDIEDLKNILPEKLVSLQSSGRELKEDDENVEIEDLKNILPEKLISLLPEELNMNRAQALSLLNPSGPFSGFNFNKLLGSGKDMGQIKQQLAAMLFGNQARIGGQVRILYSFSYP